MRAQGELRGPLHLQRPQPTGCEGSGSLGDHEIVLGCTWGGALPCWKAFSPVVRLTVNHGVQYCPPYGGVRPGEIGGSRTHCGQWQNQAPLSNRGSRGLPGHLALQGPLQTQWATEWAHPLASVLVP